MGNAEIYSLKPLLYPNSGNLEYSPRLYFLGDRNYLHASTLYNAILGALSDFGLPPVLGAIRMDIHSLITRKLDLFFTNGANSLAPSKKPSSYFEIESNNLKVKGFALERDEPIVKKSPFDESIIESVSQFEDKTVRILEYTGMPPIQIVLSLNKQLHSALKLNNTDKPMLAVRLDLYRPFDDDDALEMNVTLQNSIGSRLTRTTIHSGNKELGSLYTSQEKL